MRIQQTLAAAALVLAGNPVPANNLVPALPLVKPSVVAVGTELPTRTPPVNLGGSGFAVGDGLYIVTNAHVIPPLLDIANQERIGVMIAQGAVKKFRYAKIAQVDTTHDIALLRLEGEPLPTVQLGDSDTLVEGQALAMTGYPIGMALQQMVTHRGIVSSVITSAVQPPTAGNLTAGAIRQLRDGPFVLLQLDATAYPGNSGGPLLDAESGQVVGVISMVLVKGTRESALTHPSGISYAVPVQYLSALIKGS